MYLSWCVFFFSSLVIRSTTGSGAPAAAVVRPVLRDPCLQHEQTATVSGPDRVPWSSNTGAEHHGQEWGSFICYTLFSLTWFSVCKVTLTSWLFLPVRLHGSSSGGPAWERSHRWTHVSQFTQCFTSFVQRSGSNALHRGFCQHWLMVLFYSVWVA